ncbi:MAG: hypothetical protein AABZ36_07740, partial [Nitrospirota bacterium]
MAFGLGLYRCIKTAPPGTSVRIDPDGPQRHFSGWENLAFLLPALFLIEGLIQFYGQPCLPDRQALFHLLYIPLIVIASAFLSFRIIAG